jgi:CHASE2 domain-containing sensor protein
MMRKNQRGGILASLAGIVVCGGIGGFLAWTVVSTLDIEGVAGALAATAIGMLAATALWVAGGWALRASGIVR